MSIFEVSLTLYIEDITKLAKLYSFIKKTDNRYRSWTSFALFHEETVITTVRFSTEVGCELLLKHRDMKLCLPIDLDKGINFIRTLSKEKKDQITLGFGCELTKLMGIISAIDEEIAYSVSLRGNVVRLYCSNKKVCIFDVDEMRTLIEKELNQSNFEVFAKRFSIIVREVQEETKFMRCGV